MSDNVIQLNQDLIHNELKELVRGSVEETLMLYLIMKRMNSLMLINVSVLENVKAIVPIIMIETLLLLLVM